MKCFEIKQCSDNERNSCYVWNTFHNNPEEMEKIKCWILKGVYNEPNKESLKKCHVCKYYISMNGAPDISQALGPDIALISLQGTINNDKTRVIEKIWNELKTKKKFKILLDVGEVNNIYSCGLGILITIHKEAAANKGLLVICGAGEYIQSVFTSTKLSRILKIATDRQHASVIFDEFKTKELASIQAAEEAVRPRSQEPKKLIPCWEYFNNHNPNNATSCDECYKKESPSLTACWIVDGMVEGVSFQFVDEECEGCPYYLEYGNVPSGSA